MEFDYEKLNKKEKAQYDKLDPSGKQRFEKLWLSIKQEQMKINDLVLKNSQAERKRRNHLKIMCGGEVESIIGYQFQSEEEITSAFRKWLKDCQELNPFTLSNQEPQS